MIDGLVLVRGCGDIGSGVIHRLVRCGFKVVGIDIARPTAIRRQVAFAQAIYDGKSEVEGLCAISIDRPQDAMAVIAAGNIPILVDENAQATMWLRPDILVDAILAKTNLGTHRDLAPIIIALGPGFHAGRDVHAVIETQRGHNLGRVIYDGCAAPDTGMPGNIAGFDKQRIIRAPASGEVKHVAEIGALLSMGDLVAYVNGQAVIAPLGGVLRGLIQQGIQVPQGLKIGDIDPRSEKGHCGLISDKARTISGGVVEAILHLSRTAK